MNANKQRLPEKTTIGDLSPCLFSLMVGTIKEAIKQLHQEFTEKTTIGDLNSCLLTLMEYAGSSLESLVMGDIKELLEQLRLKLIVISSRDLEELAYDGC